MIGKPARNRAKQLRDPWLHLVKWI